MGYRGFEQFEEGLLQDISHEEHRQTRALFEETVTDTMLTHMSQTLTRRRQLPGSPPRDRILLKSILPDLSFVAIYIGNYSDSVGSYGTVTLNWLTGGRAGEDTVYGPDEETEGVRRRDISKGAKAVIASKLVELLLHDPKISDTEEVPVDILEVAAEDPTTRSALEEGERLRPVGLEEVRWLAQLIQHAVPHTHF